MADFHYKDLGENEDITSVVLSGRLDAFSVDYLFSCIESQIQSGCKKLILDCTQLNYISSVGLGMLLRIHGRMAKQGGDVKIAGVHGAVAQVIGLVRLDQVLQMYPTVSEAVSAHGG